MGIFSIFVTERTENEPEVTVVEFRNGRVESLRVLQFDLCVLWVEGLDPWHFGFDKLRAAGHKAETKTNRSQNRWKNAFAPC